MLNTTLCYILRGNEVLMLHRTKKKNDLNQDKWIGIGGNFEEGESPDECLLREAKEAGCKCVGGKGMLLWQGVSAFKLYTGKDMPVEEVKERFFS